MRFGNAPPIANPHSLPQSNPVTRSQEARVKPGGQMDHVRLEASVTVTVPARLHFGFLDLDGGLGRRFGSMGLAISGPRTRLTIAPAAAGEISGPESGRAGRFLAAMQQALDLPGAHRLTID